MLDIQTIEPGSDAFHQELAALARLVTFARQNANSLNIAFPTYCLDLALAAILEEMNGTSETASRPTALAGLNVPRDLN